MPDSPVEPGDASRYPAEAEARVAVLEQIARSTAASLERIERRLETGFAHADNRMDRLDHRIDAFAAEHHTDFRWLVGVMMGATGTILAALTGLLDVMAHGFHWL